MTEISATPEEAPLEDLNSPNISLRPRDPVLRTRILLARSQSIHESEFRSAIQADRPGSGEQV